MSSDEAHSAAWRRVMERARRVAQLRSPVLLLGPTGVGKSRLARIIHAESGRAGSIEEVNCAALPDTLVESELYGVTVGTASDVHGRPGLFERAGAGTAFLDEIGEMPLHQQSVLLTALTERSIRRVGATSSLPMRCRVVAATNRDPVEAMREGVLRQDLFFRIGTHTIEVPSLSQRQEDIMAAAREFLAEELGTDSKLRFAPDVDDLLLGIPWDRGWLYPGIPGQFRELRMAVCRAVVAALESGSKVVAARHFHAAVSGRRSQRAASPSAEPTSAARRTPASLRVIEALRAEPGLTPSALGAQLGMTRQHATRVCAELEAQGIVANRGGRRHLTDVGQRHAGNRHHGAAV